MKTYKITTNQLDVLKVLWNSDKALSATDIIDLNLSLNINTVRVSLQKLLKHGIIAVDNIIFSGTVLTRTYRAALSSESYIADNFSKHPKHFNMPALLANFTETEKTEVIDNIEATIEKQREKIREGS